MKPLRDLGDPDLRPRTGGMAAMGVGFFVIVVAVVLVTIAALSAAKMAMIERELDALRQILADNVENDEALADAIAAVAVENRIARGADQ